MYVLYTHLNVSGVQEELVPLDGQLGMLRSLQHYYGLSIPPAHCADAEHDPPTADTIRTHKYTYMYMPGWNGSRDCARSRGIAAILRANYAPFLRAISPFNAKTR